MNLVIEDENEVESGSLLISPEPSQARINSSKIHEGYKIDVHIHFTSQRFGPDIDNDNKEIKKGRLD